MSLILLTIAYNSFDFYIIIITWCSPTRANYNVMYSYTREISGHPLLIILFILLWGN